ncbi:hypothetical protein EPO33_02940 [Patescibacteria group bacterium]|nr:MAG: hypothetical protein EPO33_02940 [Patescibacteria group bacterium]
MTSSTLGIPPGFDWANLLLNVGSISGLFLLPYSVLQAIRKTPSIRFDMRGRSGTMVKDGDRVGKYRIAIAGTIKNKSDWPTSIVNVYLVVWHPKYKNATLRFGFNPDSVIDPNSGQNVAIPLRLDSCEAKRIDVVFHLETEGTADAKLLREYRSVAPGSPFVLSKYTYELVFEDIHGNFFDEKGASHSKKEIDLRWTLENTFHDLKNGNPLPYVWHIFRIWRAGVIYRLKTGLHWFGLWR